LGIVIIPTDELIFFRGVGQPPTSMVFRGKSIISLGPLSAENGFDVNPLALGLNMDPILWVS